MNATAYITSGLLERYAVGLASPEEILEVQEMASQHTEIQEELRDIRRALQGYVLAHQVTPPDGLREQLVANDKAMPSQPTAPVKRSVEAAPVAPRRSSNGSSESRPANVAAIAAVLLGLALAGAAFTAWVFFQDAEKRKGDVAAAQAQIEQLQQEKTDLLERQGLLADQLGLLRDPGMVPIVLRGTVQAPSAKAVIYWNGPKKISHLDVQQLPNVPEGKKLQLWSVVNRRPQPIGGLVTNGPTVLQALQFVENPEAYYVTLEDAAAEPERPDLRQVVMYVKTSF